MSGAKRPDVRSWRGGLLRAILRAFVLLGAFAYVPCLWLSVRERLWLIAAADTVVYGAVLFLHFARGLSDRARAGGLLAIHYLLSVLLLAELGPFGAGDLWLFAFPILAGALIGVRAAIAALGLNLATLAAFAAALPLLARTSEAWADRSLFAWVAIAVNFLLLDAVVTLSIATLVSRLDQALARVRYARARVNAERAELLRSNQRLRDQVVERQAAEQKRNELEKQLLQAQKMEAVGRLAGGIAHDFNNLLTAILGYSDLATAKLRGSPVAREELSEIRRAASRAADLTRQLLAFGRKQVLQTQVLSLTDCVRETEKMLRRVLPENVRLETRVGGEHGRVCADAGQVEQVIVNLAINARDAMPRGGTVVIRTADVRIEGALAGRLAMPTGDYVELSVEDDGAGMDALTQSRIFEPFFTTKEVGKGTGLGLATVYGIVKQSGGEIRVESAPGRGTRFQVLLPRVEDAGAVPVERAPAAPERRGSETLLLVEDDENVRRLTWMILEQQGYRVLVAASGSRALEIAADLTLRIDLVLSDVVMPGMSGHELLERVRRLRPDVRALYMTGYVDDAVLPAGAGDAFLGKPFLPSDLARAVREVLDAVEERR